MKPEQLAQLYSKLISQCEAQLEQLEWERNYWRRALARVNQGELRFEVDGVIEPAAPAPTD